MTQELLAVIGGAVAVATAIFHGAMFIGKLTVKVERHEDRLNKHDKDLDRLEAVAR
jgi:hypothetical protein